MSRTANLRREHDSASRLAKQIGDEIAYAGDAPHADTGYRLSILLAKLTGTLRIHFAAEDRILYPSLMAAGRGGVAATARRFFEEMGQIGPAYAAYAEEWSSGRVILADWMRFRRETTALFAALSDRIRRENEELYPLADALDEDAAPIRAA